MVSGKFSQCGPKPGPRHVTWIFLPWSFGLEWKRRRGGRLRMALASELAPRTSTRVIPDFRDSASLSRCPHPRTVPFLQSEAGRDMIHASGESRARRLPAPSMGPRPWRTYGKWHGYTMLGTAAKPVLDPSHCVARAKAEYPALGSASQPGPGDQRTGTLVLGRSRRL